MLLLDEREAREFAEAKGLKNTGALGILIAAKTKGLITEVRPIVITLRERVDFWLSEALCNRVLQVANELPL